MINEAASLHYWAEVIIMRYFVLSLVVPCVLVACSGAPMSGDAPGETETAALGANAHDGGAAPDANGPVVPPLDGSVGDGSVSDGGESPDAHVEPVACIGPFPVLGPAQKLTTEASARADIAGTWNLCSQNGATGIQGFATVKFGASTYTLSGGGTTWPDQTAPLVFQRTPAGLAVLLTDVWFTMEYDQVSRDHMRIDDAYLPGTALLTRVEHSPAACSLVGGTWDVASNAFYGTNASFQFDSDGKFIGGPRSAQLPKGAIYAGDWEVSKGVLIVDHTVGMQCNDYDTHMAVTFDATCTTATLDNSGLVDNCTGGRKYFEAVTVLKKR